MTMTTGDDDGSCPRRAQSSPTRLKTVKLEASTTVTDSPLQLYKSLVLIQIEEKTDQH